MTDEKSAHDRLRKNLEVALDDQTARYQRTKVHPVLPMAFFSVASRECRDDFVAGRFYSCITLAQSVAEGLARYIAEKNNLRVVDDFDSQVNILQTDRKNPAISPAAFKAFKRIHGKDRNDFHHFNPEIEQSYAALQSRAEECVKALYEIESEVFAFDVRPGGIIHLSRSQYWDVDSEGRAKVHVCFL